MAASHEESRTAAREGQDKGSGQGNKRKEPDGMEKVYLITGATGFLGREVARQLATRQEKVIGLRLPGDKAHLLPEVEYVMGDITKPYSLKNFFGQAEGKEAVLIHCAGLVTVASKEESVWSVNVDGTRNIVDLCEQYHISKLVYVSSVHAIEEKEKGQAISETEQFSASKVEGIYGKSKAEATAYALKAAERGLPVSIVHPSGIIGPGDISGGYMTETIRAYLKGCFPYAVEGGYDFVDVRDVAVGIIQCAQKGRSGETYILSNEYITVRRMFDILSSITGKRKVYGTVPLPVLRWAAPFCEKAEKALGMPLLVTPYSAYTLGSNGNFCHEKAEKELGYTVRPVEETLADIVSWIEKKG